MSSRFFPNHDEGPITITIDYLMANEIASSFALFMRSRPPLRRNGAFECRVDESLDQSGIFRLEYQVSTWAEHLRLRMRMTVEETEAYKKAWSLHSGGCEPAVRHFRSTQRVMHLPGFGVSGRTFMNTSRMPKPRMLARPSEASEARARSRVQPAKLRSSCSKSFVADFTFEERSSRMDVPHGATSIEKDGD